MPKRLRADSDPPVFSTSSFQDAASPGAPPSPASNIEHLAKYTLVDHEELASSKHEAMKCQLPPHAPLSFSTYDEYEVHYKAAHTNRCSECRRNFPSDHYLTLHIAENHDPLREA